MPGQLRGPIVSGATVIIGGGLRSFYGPPPQKSLIAGQTGRHLLFIGYIVGQKTPFRVISSRPRLSLPTASRVRPGRLPPVTCTLLPPCPPAASSVFVQVTGGCFLDSPRGHSYGRLQPGQTESSCPRQASPGRPILLSCLLVVILSPKIK